jgi:hypothetical protein
VYHHILIIARYKQSASHSIAKGDKDSKKGNEDEVESTHEDEGEGQDGTEGEDDKENKDEDEYESDEDQILTPVRKRSRRSPNEGEPSSKTVMLSVSAGPLLIPNN